MRYVSQTEPARNSQVTPTRGRSRRDRPITISFDHSPFNQRQWRSLGWCRQEKLLVVRSAAAAWVTYRMRAQSGLVRRYTAPWAMVAVLSCVVQQYAQGLY